MFLRTEYCNTNMKELDRRRRGKARYTHLAQTLRQKDKDKNRLTGKVLSLSVFLSLFRSYHYDNSSIYSNWHHRTLCFIGDLFVYAKLFTMLDDIVWVPHCLFSW